MTNRMAPAAPTIAQNDIGGAIVRRPFMFHDRQMKVNDLLSEMEVRSIPRNNRNSLRDNNFIQIYPKQAVNVAPPADGLTRMLVHRGKGLYDVFDAVKINDKPVRKDEGEALIAAAEQPKN